MHFRTFLKLVDSFYLMMFYGESLLDMKLLYYNEEASYFSDRGALQRAIESYNRALDLDPDNFYAHAGLASLFVGQREFQRALEHADRAFTSKTRDVVRSSRISLNFIRLLIFEMLGRSDDAKKVLDRLLISLGDDLAPVYNRLAHLYFDLGIYDKATHYCTEAIALHPEEPGNYQNLALVYLTDGKPEKAKESLVEAQKFIRTARQGRAIERQIRKVAVASSWLSCMRKQDHLRL